MLFNNTRISSLSLRASDLWIGGTTTGIPKGLSTKEQGTNTEAAKDTIGTSRNVMKIVLKRISLGLSKGELRKSMLLATLIVQLAWSSPSIKDATSSTTVLETNVIITPKEQSILISIGETDKKWS